MCYLADRVLNIAIKSLPETSHSVIDISSAILTPIIAVIAAYIAYQQYQINKQRLRHETYENKMKIFKSVQKFLSEITANGHANFNRCHVFYSEASEAVFLFDPPVMEFIENLYGQAIELAQRNEELYPFDGSSGIQGNQRGVIASRKAELFKWFTKQLLESETLFVKHIGIKKS